MTFTLTEGELACEVTLEEVRTERRRGLVYDRGQAFAVSPQVPPALAGAAARMALGGPVRFAGFNLLGQPIYRLER